MDKVLKQLDVIKDVEKRLRDLSQSRGTPVNVAADLTEKSDTLKWAHLELRKQFVSDVLLLVGDTDVLLGFSSVPSEELVTLSDNPLVGYTIMVKPDAIISEPLLEHFRDGAQEDQSPEFPGCLPEWLKCRNYFVTHDSVGKAALLECVILRQWLNDVGYRTAKTEVAGWLVKIFPLIQWKDR